MSRKPDTLFFINQRYNFAEDAENICDMLEVRGDTGVETFLRGRLSTIVDYIHGESGPKKIFVDDLKSFGEGLIAHVMKDLGGGLSIYERDYKMHCKDENGNYDNRNKWRITGNNAKWYKLEAVVYARYAEYRDWSNMLTAGLDAIAKNYGEPGKPEVYAVKNAYFALKRVHDIGGKLTVGGVALADFKHNYIKNFSKKFPKLSREDDAFVRRAYHGGLAGFNPKFGSWENAVCGDGVAVDRNSMYSAEALGAIPFGEPAEIPQEKLEALALHFLFNDDSGFDYMRLKSVDEYLEDWTAFVEVSFKAQSNGGIPCVCGDKELHKAGDSWVTNMSEPETAVFTIPDMRMLFKYYNVEEFEIIRGVEYKSSRGIFREFVEHWGNVKREARISGDVTMATLAKMMLNNLVGKFGTKPFADSTYVSEWDDRVIYKTAKSETKGAFVPVAAYVTARSREVLADLAMKDWGSVMRYDTDCIFFDCDKSEIFDIGSEVGQWKVEHRYSACYSIGAKAYILVNDDGTVTLKASGANKEVIEEALRRIVVKKTELRTHVVKGEKYPSVLDMPFKEWSAEVVKPKYQDRTVTEFVDCVDAEATIANAVKLMAGGGLDSVPGKIVYIHDYFGAHRVKSGSYSFNNHT